MFGKFHFCFAKKNFHSQNRKESSGSLTELILQVHLAQCDFSKETKVLKFIINVQFIVIFIELLQNISSL